MSLKFFSILAVALLAGCVSNEVKVGDDSARGPVTGSAGGATAQNTSSQLERCDTPLGTVGVIEDTGTDWYRILTSQYHLPATTPLIRLMIQQSNCFVVVDRGRGLQAAQTERALQSSGELRSKSSFGKGQLVSADYSMTPSIQFSQTTGGGSAGAIIGVFSPLAGALAGSVKTREAATTLILVDNRSGVQVAVSEGAASKTDVDIGGALFGGGGAVGLGAYQNTPQGKIIGGAFMDAYNQMVKALRNYRAQKSGNKTGLGTGGALKVDGQSTPASEADAPTKLAKKKAKRKAQPAQ